MATTVVSSAYDTSGNGGRKIVRLSNDWLICVVWDSTTPRIRWYKSTDNGATWSQLCSANYTGTNIAMCSNGTIVYTLHTYSGDNALFKFDATTQADVDITHTSRADTGQTSYLSVSFCIDGDGYLHAVWCSKNATYPNSFNIRYSKSTDGGATWAAPTQITTTNTTNINNTKPCIAVKSDNNPVIVWVYAKSSATASYIIKLIKYNGSSWDSAVNVYDSGTYEYNTAPCLAIDSNDCFHVVWESDDSSASTVPNIRYSKSLDGGANWKKADGTAGHDKLTSDTTYNQQWASIVLTSTNNIYIFWNGIDTAVSSTYQNCRKISHDGNSWSSITTITNNTTNHAYRVQALWSKFNMNSNDAVRFIYQDLENSAVQYDSILLGWSHKLMGITPTKIMGVQPSKVMGIS